MTFLQRLRSDTSGNALMLTAAAMVPLIGVIGGGLDISRIYLVESRLQQACDSATLAARRQLGGNSMTDGNVPENIRTTANNFFNNNFRNNMYGAENDVFTVTAGGETRLNGTATVEVPMTLMSVFNIDKHEVNVTCSAELNLPNIDVMLVLDMSGSMEGERIADLKAAVLDFYDEVMAVKPDEARIRIGFMPYSAAVNVGEVLRNENPDFLADSFTYQSREAVFKQVSNNDRVEVGDRIEESWTTELLPRNPVQLGFADEPQYHWNKNNNGHRNNCLNYNGTYEVDGAIWEISDATWRPNHWGDAWPNDLKAACRAEIHKYRVAEEDDVREETFTQVFDYYIYRPIVFDTSAFKMGETVQTPTGTRGANVESTWIGCIEERQTVAQATFNTIPAAAFDLDINKVPSAGDPATQWRPMWPQITYDRGGPDPLQSTQNKSTRNASCASPAVKLTEFPLEGGMRNEQFEDHVQSLTPRGGTMHDIGMIWAARFISPNGIFADENAEAPNGDPIARHIIFMTDGEMRPGPVWTTSYGNYDMDGRMAGFAPDGSWSEEELAAIHNSRFDAVCRQVRNNNITIWTVSFGLPLNDHTRGCATGTGRAFEADDAETLSNAFKQIAGSIAELRLVE